MGSDDAALTFVAKLDDQASAASKVLEKNLDDLGGPIAPITGTADLDVDRIIAALNSIDGHLEGFVEESKRAGEEAGEKAGDGFSNGLKGVLTGGVLLKAAEIGGQLVGEAFGQALDQETDTAHLTGALGLDPAESERAGAVAGALYAGAYGESMGDVTGAVGAVMSSIDGLRDGTEAALTAASEDALNFADVFEVDVARGAQIAGQLMRTGLAGDAEEAFDLMTAAAQKVPANIREDLLDAADEYGPFFASLGMSGEQAFAALVAGADQGMYGIDKTGDALKELTIRATDMSKSSIASFEAAGLNAEDMAAKFLAGGDTAAGGLSELVDGLLAIPDPTQRANAAIGLFGTPLEDLGVDKIPQFLTSLKGGEDGLGDFSQATEELSDTLNGTAAVALEGQKRQLQQLATDAFAKLIPYLLSFLAWVQETPGVLTALTVGLGLAAVAWAAVTLAASPWLALGLAVAAVIAGIILVIKNWGPIMDWIGEKVSAAGQWIGQVFDNVKSWVSEKVSAIIAWVRANWPLLLAILTGPIGLAVLYVSQHMDAIKATVMEKINAVIAYFRAFPSSLLAAMGNLGSTLVGAGRDLVRGIWDGITGMGKWLMDKLAGWASSVIPGPIKKALGIASPSKVGAALGRWFGIGIGDGVMDQADYVANSSENLADAILKPMDNLDAAMGNVTAPTVTVAGRSDVATVVEIRHVITSPDGSVTELTAQQIARMIAADPDAAATTEKAVRGAVQRRDSRTLTATN